MNRNDLISLYETKLVNIDRDTSSLLNYLKTSSFFDDPASKGHHNNIPGGLALHCLNFHSVLSKLININMLPVSEQVFDPLIVAIGHDLNKVGYYTQSERNTKINNQWVALRQYEYVKSRDTIPHNMVSLELISPLINLSAIEDLAIFWAEGSWSTHNSRELDSAWKNAMAIDYRIYLTHTADMIASQFMEKTYSPEEVNAAIRDWK